MAQPGEILKSTAVKVTRAWRRFWSGGAVPSAPVSGPPTRVNIGNRADGGIVYWVGKLYGFAVLLAIAAMSVVTIGTYGYFAAEAPPTPDLTRYADIVPGVSRVYAADGTLLGEFAEEWRELTPFDQIPEPLVNAFLAVEDHEFFEHRGIYFKGIARAAWRNFVAGDFAQGGSTITQQVAKQFLGSEKSLTRKAKEAIMARRLEATYSKRAILAVYLNHIFLGNGAYGVKAAAQRYFGKKLEDLNLGEMATIAGLAQAPSYYSPVRRPERAIERRNAVLDKMLRHGFADKSEVERWKGEPLVLASYESIFGNKLPYYAEHVRAHIGNKYGEDALLRQGLRVETAAEPVTEALAYENIDYGARRQDKRQGWRGPETHLDDGQPRALFRERSAAHYGPGPLIPRRRYLGLVEEVSAKEATVRVGATTYELPLSNANWAATWTANDDTNDRVISSLTSALSVGDVIWVSKDHPEDRKFKQWRQEGTSTPKWIPAPSDEKLERLRKQAEGRLALEQVPHVQSALFTGDHKTGYVVAMVGGTDHDRSQLNRTTQSCRQPGSTYKPIYYSAALDQGYGFDTALADIPRGEIDPNTGQIWVPKNLGGTVDFIVSMEYALVFSKNIASLSLFKKIGADNVEKWARRLGFTGTIFADKALALGASCTTLDQLSRAFAIFARNGRWMEWIYVKRVFDRNGNIVEDNSAYFDPHLPPSDRLDRMANTAGVVAKQAIPERTGFLTSKLLAQVVKHGFSGIIRATEVECAGKTGTSSATMDTTFVAYTSRWLTTVWAGDDMRERPLGTKDAAYIVVEPMWARFMADAAEGHTNQEIPWEVPEGVDPNDRGDHSQGTTHRMSLVYREGGKAADAIAPENP